MEEDYYKMMSWCLGEDWSNQNIKATPAIWETLHLDDEYRIHHLDNRPMAVNMSYYTFQMTLIWMLRNNLIPIAPQEPEETPDLYDEEKTENNVGFFTHLKNIFTDFLKP